MLRFYVNCVVLLGLIASCYGRCGLLNFCASTSVPGLKLALWQGWYGAELDACDVEAHVEVHANVTAEAARRGAELVVFPELSVVGQDCSAREFCDVPREVRDGSWFAALGEVARTHGVAIAYGYVEDGGDGVLYNAVQLIGDRGESLWNYRKSNLAGGDDCFRAGRMDPWPVAHYRGHNISAIICQDVSLPENARLAAIGGATLLLHPMAKHMPPAGFSWHAALVPSRAYENSFNVATVNWNAPGNDTESFLPNGGSVVVDNTGESIAAAPFGSDTANETDYDPDWRILYASVDPLECDGPCTTLNRRIPSLYGPLLTPCAKNACTAWLPPSEE